MAQTKTPRNGLDSLARDIALVLERMGGSAHQTVVIDCVAALATASGSDSCRARHSATLHPAGR